MPGTADDASTRSDDERPCRRPNCEEEVLPADHLCAYHREQEELEYERERYFEDALY